MRLATIRTSEGSRLHVRGRSGYVDVASESGRPELATLNGLLAGGVAALDVAAGLTSREGREYDETDLDAAVPRPNRVMCVGVNYSAHAVEGGRDANPTWPESFMRSASSVLAPYADLARPALSSGFDYEGELAIVIGSGGRYIPREKAMDAIAGFTVLNDGSAREWQRAATQWTPGKNFDASMPIGPEVVTADEVSVDDLAITTTLNGAVMQSARTSQMIVDVARCIEFFSSFTKLLPGDVIATGTPGGVGFARTPPVWLTPGDVIEVTVEGVGTIRNKVVEDEPAPAGWPWLPSATATGIL
ncbi:fumarylacetoacetate hydrolase family protein [Pedococcus sp.]|uniref:fumarylacetoacetate hydrolase family protein n=1 Tax=Pedococcus sp. TaxID=2860345 RepID=UPI002E10C8D7|nr:fumarylacetoacetate hydrolase family protein [Pedococcus sp.]